LTPLLLVSSWLIDKTLLRWLWWCEFVFEVDVDVELKVKQFLACKAKVIILFTLPLPAVGIIVEARFVSMPVLDMLCAKVNINIFSFLPPP
jgi:hypothetical protein